MRIVASCMVLVTAARIRPMARNEQTPSEAMTNSESQFCGIGMRVVKVRHGQQDDDHGKVEQPAADHGGDQKGHRRDGRDFEAAQDVGLALLHERMPAPQRPLPRIPMVSTVPTK